MERDLTGPIVFSWMYWGTPRPGSEERTITTSAQSFHWHGGGDAREKVEETEMGERGREVAGGGVKEDFSGKCWLAVYTVRSLCE